MRIHQLTSLALLLGAACTNTSDTSSSINSGKTSGGKGGGVRGAIFTTTVDGTVVNENHYVAKTDVYLDGGPGMNAPSKAAALAAGDYYFQVTDPSGKRILSSDDISCRKIKVSSDGVIVAAIGAAGCNHATGTDADYASLGAKTVQLAPYADTPNNGGVYKVWVTPVDKYDDGFVNRFSKTDNFKVGPDAPPPPPPSCGDGDVDTGEQCDDGNTMNGDGCSAGCTNEPEPCCGDGHLDTGEECDDGNTSSGDGCSAVCKVEEHVCVCGDGHVDAPEQCDDGNTTSGDGCSATCVHEPKCGDGHLDGNEQCDDGNIMSGDGCSSTCVPEKIPCCGDHVIDAGEQCDDGNTSSGDGCSATCQLEQT